MRRTTVASIIIVAIAAATAIFARFGPGKITPVTGLIGSEEAPCIAEVRVQNALAWHELQVIVQTSGSHKIASQSDLKSHVSDVSYG